METGFSPVTLKQKDRYYEIWEQTPLHSLDYTLTNLWGWQEYYGLEWRFERDLCWIRQTLPQTVYWAPIGNWTKAGWPKELLELAEKNIYHFHRVPEMLVEIWRKNLQEKVLAEDERGQWEYLYRQDELAELAGSKFHKKRNHLNSYIKTYGEPDYEVVDEKRISDVLGVQDIWCHWHECDDSQSLKAENHAVNRVLKCFSEFRDLVGGSLYIDGKMIAFSIGEKLDDKNLGVHFEKGLNGYKGVYQAMNYEFARIAGNGFEWINRAQDLDEEGLRQAKLTYMPAGFLKKYSVVINNS